MKQSLIIALFLLGVMSNTVFSQSQIATSWTRTFSFGATTSKTSENYISNKIPTNVPARATIEISAKRNSQKGASTTNSMVNTIPLKIELISPPATFGDDKSSTIVTKSVTAGSTPRTITIDGSPAPNGCGSYTWKVNINAVDDADLSEYTISGKIILSFPPATFQFSIEDSSNINLEQNNWVDKDIVGDNTTQGVVEVTGEWFSRNTPAQPIRMKIELILTNGLVLSSSEGYPINETRTGAEFPKLRFVHTINGSLSGSKLRITNTGSGFEAIKIRPIIKKTRSCGIIGN